MTDRLRRRRLIAASAGAVSLTLHKSVVRGVERALDEHLTAGDARRLLRPRRRRR